MSVNGQVHLEARPWPTTDEWLTIPAAAVTLGLPERFLRRYVERHAARLEVRTHGRHRLVSARALTVLNGIHELYGCGRSPEQVDDLLAVTAEVLWDARREAAVLRARLAMTEARLAEEQAARERLQATLERTMQPAQQSSRGWWPWRGRRDPVAP